MGKAADLLGLPASWQDHVRVLFTDAIATGLKVTAWIKGSPTRSIYYGVSKSLDRLSIAVGQIADQGFRSTATGEGLTRHVKEVSGIERRGKTYATTTLLITNSAGGNYPWSPNAPLLITSTITKKQYQSQGSGVIEPFAVAVELPISATEAGSASTALPGEIDEWVSSVDALTIDQPNPAIGDDEQSDDELRAAGDARVGFVPTESTIGAGGAAGSYESVARSGPDGKGGVLRANGSRISVTRVRIEPNGSGGAEVIVADADGPITSPDLALVDAAIKVWAMPLGITTSAAANSSAQNIAIEYEAFVPADSPATDNDIESAAEVAVIAYFSKCRIGGYELSPGSPIFPIDRIRRVIGNAIGSLAGQAVTITMITPSADVAASSIYKVPVLSGTPTATITRITAELDE